LARPVRSSAVATRYSESTDLRRGAAAVLSDFFGKPISLRMESV